MNRVMTYDELAETFGITRKSAEQLVKRKRWMRRKGNDGKARIVVPEDALPPSPRTPSEPPHDGVHQPPREAPHEALQEGVQESLLKSLIERLESEIAELRPKALERE